MARRSLTAVTYGSSPHAELRAGYANVHGWLTSLGLARFNLPASLVALGALGWWVRRHRQADFWLLLGTTAIVSRLWVYHRLYDDSIVLFSMLALYRIAVGCSPGDPRRVIAASLLALTTAVMLAPARIYEFWPNPWPIAYAAAHLGVWLAMLALLLFETERRRRMFA